MGTKPIIYINREVREQILALSNVAKNKEWSGILFYKQIAGSYKKIESLKFELIGIYPLEIGSEVFVEHVYSNSVGIAYDYFPIEAQTGLIHSHNTMGVFFSGTDTDTLKTSCHNYNFLLSFIVNVFGEYCAKIAFPCKTEIIETKEYLDTNGNIVKRKENRVENSEIIVDCDIVLKEANKEWFSEKIKSIVAENSKKSIYNGYGVYDSRFFRGENYHGYSNQWRRESATPGFSTSRPEAPREHTTINLPLKGSEADSSVRKSYTGSFTNLDQLFALQLINLLSDEKFPALYQAIYRLKIEDGEHDSISVAVNNLKTNGAITELYKVCYKTQIAENSRIYIALNNAVEEIREMELIVARENEDIFDMLESQDHFSKLDEIDEVIINISEELYEEQQA